MCPGVGSLPSIPPGPAIASPACWRPRWIADPPLQAAVRRANVAAALCCTRTGGPGHHADRRGDGHRRRPLTARPPALSEVQTGGRLREAGAEGHLIVAGKGGHLAKNSSISLSDHFTSFVDVSQVQAGRCTDSASEDDAGRAYAFSKSTRPT